MCSMTNKKKKKTRNRTRRKVTRKAPRRTRIEYFVAIDYKGFDPDFDKELCKMTGRRGAGSGFFFPLGLRDYSWLYHRKDAATRIAKKLAKLKRVLSVRIATYFPDVLHETIKKRPRMRKKKGY